MCAITENYFKNGRYLYMMNWKEIWMSLFGTSDLWGIDMGFWTAIAAVAVIVVVMNVVFWGMKPGNKN